MPNFSGLLNNMDQTGFPEEKKPAADLFTTFGILSPSEKRAQAMQQQMVQGLLQQQMAAQQQQLQMQKMQTGASAGSGFGFPTALAMGAARRPESAQQPQGGGPQGLQPGGDIDAGSIFSQELQSTPDDEAGAAKRAGGKLLAVANARGDTDLAKIATNMINWSNSKAQEDAKSKASLASTQAGTAKTVQDTKLDSSKAGNPGDAFNVRAPNGDMVAMAMEKDANGKFIGYKVLGQGPNKQISQTIDDPLTQTQKGEEYLQFQKLLGNSDTAILSMRDIADNMEKGAAQGWAGNGVTLMSNIVGTLEQFRPDVQYTPRAMEELSSRSGSFKEWATKTGVNESIWNDLVSNLAKTYNPTGTITEKDITRAAKTVGQNFSSPATVAAILRDAERRSRRLVDKTYSYMGEGARAASKSQYERFTKAMRRVKRRGTRPNGIKVVEYDDGTVEDDNAPTS